MRRVPILLALLWAGWVLAIAPASAQTLVPGGMGGFPIALSVGDTDTLILCTTSGGCATGVQLDQVTAAVLATYFASRSQVLTNQSIDFSANTATNIPSSALVATGVTAGGYICMSGTVNAEGQLTVASNGACGPAGTSGQLQYNNAGTSAGFTMGGDCTIVASTGVITCTETNGTAFAASATTDTTAAGNITSGNLDAARMATNLGAAVSTVCSGSTTNFVRGDGTCVAPTGSGNMTGSAATTTGNLLMSNNTGSTLNTAADAGIGADAAQFAIAGAILRIAGGS